VRVLALEWTDPPLLGGHWVPALVAVAGGEHLLSGPGTPSRRCTWDDVADADPDALVVLPCGYELDVAVAEFRRLLDDPRVASLRALREGRTWVTAASRLFSRCTPEAVARGAEVLAGLLHPGRVEAPSRDEAVALV
jgi:iron complex transport system substrate-binding protein